MNTLRIQQELALPRIDAPRIPDESAPVNEDSGSSATASPGSSGSRSGGHGT